MTKQKREFAAFTVTRLEQGRTLQEFLAERLKLSRRQAKELIDTRAAFVNRQSIWMARHKLQSGDVVETRLYEPPPKSERKLRLLAEDEHYLFVDKPCGMLSVGSDSVETTLRSQLGEPALRCVHRLDRDTSGCLLVARSAQAFERAVEIFKTRRVKKSYDALLAGRMTQPVMTIEEPLGGLPARTHVRRLICNKDATFARIRIETGRTHQIRRHLAAVRHPVIGDRLHGLKESRDQRLMYVPRQMLHAVELEMPHPCGDGRLRAHSPLPADFRRCLRLFDLGK